MLRHGEALALESAIIEACRFQKLTTKNQAVYGQQYILNAKALQNLASLKK